MVPIELFVAVGDGDSELQFEEPGEHTVTDPEIIYISNLILNI